MDDIEKVFEMILKGGSIITEIIRSKLLILNMM